MLFASNSQGTHTWTADDADVTRPRPTARNMGKVESEARVLVVDDEAHLAELVATTLRFEGFATETALTGREALEKIERFEPHLVILDVTLPDLDGFDIQSRLRQDGTKVAVLFLTARDDTQDKVRGLTLGADDYVTKPFSLEELLARIRAILRRVHSDPRAPSVLRLDDLELDEDAHEVRRDGTQIVLSATEYHLLRYLMLNSGRVVSQAQILDHVWSYDFDGDPSIVATYISYLRKKIDPPGRPSLVRTIRGFGYSLRPTRA